MNALSVPLDDQSIAVVLDLVNPIFAGRDRGSATRDAGLERRVSHGAKVGRPN